MPTHSGTTGKIGLGGTHVIAAPVAGKYARTRPPGGGSMTGTGGGMSLAKMTTSQMRAMGEVAISGTTEVAPIVEVLNMADYTHNTVSIVPVDEPIFQASPSSVTIRGFQPLETVQIQIALRNNDNVARRVKIVPPEGIYFSVELLVGKPSSKIAPGMDTHYVLKFTPEEKIDYFCDLVCYTEREKFIIPVRALGPRGWLDLPDHITFERPTVKAESVKTLLARNVGDDKCTFTLSCTKPFRANPPTATLGVGESMQIHVSFFPQDTVDVMGEVRVDYATGESVIMYASGRAEELAVRLDSQAMLMDPTYVSLFSQKTFKVINRSEETLAFCFKQFASAAEEIKARMRYGAGIDDSMDQSDVEYDDSFRNDSFAISPMSGQVWPNAEVECVVTFSPSTATEMACVAFCDVAGKQNRFPLHLQGAGIGPRIVLSYNVMDIGEVFINSVSEYDVELQNNGEIEADYNLEPTGTLFGSKFQFEPSSGNLGVGQKAPIKVSFSSDVLGEFNEDFGFALAGTPKPLTLSVRGKVIGPTFHLDETMLDFKRTSVAFLASRHLHLFNTSDIPFRFHMRVPGDGTLVKREFQVLPATGTILPHGKQRIQLDLIPLSPRNYNLQLVMDIESVGEMMAQVDIRGTSIVPDVTVSTHELDYGDCFLRYPYKKMIELVNHSDLPAKFELQWQDEISQCVAVYEVDYAKGTIEPFSSRVITVSFTTMRLDKVQLPMFFTIVGHEDDPLEVQCIANGIGPRLTLTPPSIKWGDIEVLKDFEKTLKVKNDSLVPAEFQTLVMKRNSRFKVNMPSAHLAPGETANLKLLANLDDTQPFKDELCLIVTEGGEIKVPLLAKGTGTTICCNEYELGSHPDVKLDNQFTSRAARQYFTITNRGPVPQTLSWFNGTALETLQKLKAAAAEAEAGGSKKKDKDAEIQVPETFYVEINGSKEPYVLEAGASATLEVIGFSKKAGAFAERVCCKSKMEKEQRVIIEMNVSATFVDPVCQFSVPRLDFDYKYDANEVLDLREYTQTVVLKNVCLLPLELAIKCSGLPFTVEPTDMDLGPGESQTLHVHFDPTYRGNKMSETLTQMITVAYNMGPNAVPKNERAPQGVHPKKATLELVGDINFPNIKFDKSEIKFGAVLNDTSRRIKVRCTNDSKIDATFWWSFVVPDAADKGLGKRPTSSSTTTGTAARLDPPHPINAVFDILPIRSFLKPGQSEDVEFVFYGHANHKYKATAVCEVQGGPEYEMKLDGEASSIQYKFDKTSIDFGNAFYDKFQMEELTLVNTGKVKFDFTINSDSVAPPTIIKAAFDKPGKTQVVEPGAKFKIPIQIYPGLPTLITTSFTVEVAHFEPQIIVVTGKGMFPHVAVNLPRVDPANYARLMQEAEGVLGFTDMSGAETSRTEGMPAQSQRTHQTEATEALRSGGGLGASGEMPPPTAGTRRTVATAGGVRAPPMTMETFLATNPFSRQLQAEADCLAMREYIVGQVAEKEAEEEARRKRVLFDEEEERLSLTIDLDEPDELLDAKSRPATSLSGPAAPPGPGAPEEATAAQDALAVSVFKTGLPFIDMGPFVLSEYVCDFGHVIKGQQLQKQFRVTNVGFTSISFEYPKNVKSALTQAGFVVEPDRVNRLPGAPDFESVEFNVVFNSSRPGVNLGPIDVLIPVAVKGGPQVNVYLKANVTIPDVEVSSDNLKFGSVFCGHSRHVTVQLCNNKEIPATWSFLGALASEGKGAAKPCEDFTVIPGSGTLNPGEMCNVQVVFRPSTARAYNAKIPIRINQNPTRRNLKISAQGENLGIRFDPPMMDLDPILPFVVETERKVMIYNEMDADFEFYSLDFDEQYKEEEMILQRVPIYKATMLGYEDVALLPLRWKPPADPDVLEPLRDPQRKLQAQVLEAWAPIFAAEEVERKAAEEARIKAEEEAEAARLRAEEGGGAKAPPAAEEAPAEEGEMHGEGEGEAQVSRPPTTDADLGGTLQPLEPDVPTVMPINMLVYGHPLASPQRIAKGLAYKYKTAVLDLEGMMAQFFKEAGISPFMEEVPDEEADDTPPKLVPVEGKWQLNETAAPVGAVKALQEIFFPPLPPPEEPEGGAQPPAEEGEDGEPTPDSGPPPPRVEEKGDGWLTTEFLAQLIKHKLASELQYARGVVVSGLKLKDMPELLDVAKAVEMALSGKTLQVIFPEYQEPQAPAEGEGEAAPAEEKPPASDDEEEKAQIGGEGQDEALNDEEEPTPFDEEPAPFEGEPAPFDPYGPEEEFDTEQLSGILEAFDGSFQTIVEYFDPPPKEDGEEAAAPPAEEEGEKVEKPPPTTFKCSRARRVGKQPLDEVVVVLMQGLPEPGPVPGEARPLKIPPVFDREIVVRPKERLDRRPVTNFYILTPELVPEEEGEPPAEGEEAEPKQPQYTYETKTRWVVKAKSSIELLIRFKASDTGRFEAMLGFEVAGGGVAMRGREFMLPCRGTCAYPQISQNPQSIYYRKIKTKTEKQIVSKQYIVSKNIYEFGPLLVGRSKEDYKEKYLESKDQFRITNSGLFDMHVDFNFLKDQDGAVFVVEPESLDLAVDETADVTVFAFPEQEGEFTDKLICNIKNNPEPVEISLMCTGNVPKIITDIEPRLDEEGNPIEGPLTVEFQRLLLKRKDTRVVVIKNTSLLPAKWNLLGCGVEEGFNCGKEFEISPTQGMLMPGQREEITIGFQAMEKDTFTKELTLQWIDVDDLLPEKISLPIVVTAEAYEIDFTFTFPEGEGIDFGTLKVEEGGEQSFTIANNGKYTVGYKFAFARAKRSAVAKYFIIENEPNPEDPDYKEDDPHGKSHGALEPGSEATIKIVFASKDFPGEEEVNIQNNTELRCYVSELLTGEEIFGNPIKLNVRSVFSKFRILPQKGISFGALTYNTQKTRTFDIINQGDFEFEFKIECITGKRCLRPGTANVKAITDPEFKGEDTGDGGLKVGSFVVRPASGTVAPSGEKETITVEFSAEGEASFYEVLGVQISQRDPRSDVPDQGTPYEISGESCIPGILTQDFLQIFEEAAVSRKAPSDPEEIIKNTFIEEDRTLYFGPRLVSSRSEMRVKITNPTKVPILVNVDMVAKGAEPMAFEVLEPKQLQIPMHEHRYATILFEPTGLQTFIGNFEATVEEGTDPKTNSLVFEVRGEGTLPRVSVLQPTVRNVQGQALMVFNKLLKGKTQTQTMLIKNEGILPANVRFGRLAPWPRDPDAPADEAEPVNPQESFAFTGRGQELLLQAKEERKFDVTFMPKQVGKLRAAINMVVANNEFESSTIEVAGEGFEQDVSLGNLPENSEDTLKFGNLTVGVAQQLSFTISNNSTKVWRFQWAKEDEDNYITFSPQEGHLQPGQTKDVMATILAKKELDLDAGKPFTLETTQIIYTGDGGDWDDSIKDVEWVNDGNDTAAMDASLDQSLTESPKRGGRRKPKKVVKHRPEPAYEVVRQGDPPTAEEGEEPPEDTREPIVESVIMKVSLSADYLKYAFMSKSEDGGAEEVQSLPPLVFAETMMYRERLHKFSFKNTSKSTMEYAWRICLPDGQEDLSPENPFTVEPSNGKLQPDETVQISVKFAPTEVDHFKRKILCDIPNLDTRVVKTIRPAPAEGEEEAPPHEEEDEPVPEPQPQPVLEISGKSARPLCHLELEESDWLSGGRRPPTLTAPGGKPVDPSSRCLEFESLGTQVRNTRRFFVMNPTNISYKYRWECDDGTGAAVAHLASAFKCVHKEGFVLSGKKSEMVFEYIPDSDQLLESFWRFTIPEHDISVPFILVGHVKEPRVFFDKTFCNFNSLLIDRKGVQSVKLVNREHIPFSFSFDGKTYGANADPPVVKITPSEGTVPPEGEQTIMVEFTPRLEKNYNYNAVCLVKKKATRLALNIKGEGFDNHVSISMEDERGSVQILPGGATPVDFGEVHLNELRQKTITVTNKGKYPIEYDWQTAKNRMLTIKPPRGIVQKGDKQDVKLVFHPMAEAQMLDHPVELKIINGPRYTFNLSARGRRPQLNFSFQRMDFGPCFLYRQGAAPTTAVLRLTNEDTHDISYDCEFDNKGYLEVDAPPTNLAPGQSEEIKIVFMPRELKEYSDTVPFRINGLITVNVEITGSGHECDIAVANPMNFNFSLGAVKVGSVVERRIKVKNSSAVYAECSIAAAVARLASLSISIRPTEFALRPRETIELELTYAPQDRMAPFSEDVKVHIAGVNKTLMVVNGSAVGVELKLETDMLFFGAVVANSRAKRKVQLENVGDIGTKFRWAAEAFLPDFSVEPAEGFLNPHDEVTLEFTFQPGFVNDDCRRDNVPLYIDGTDPLLMTTTGICVSQQPNEETLSFETPVRKPSVQQTPPITNKTDQPWRLIPVVDNKYWSVPDILEIPAGQSLGCALTYTPHAMTSHMDPEPEEPAEGEPPRPPPSRPRKHTGSVFIPMPDGTAVLYNLTGTAGPPEQEGETIMRQVQCKAQHTEQLPVRNWLNRPQRFTVQIEPPPEGTTSIKGATYIDVPANAERTYALRFHTFVEGSTEVKVTLTNEETGEYLYYSIQFAAAAPPVLRSFELNTVVRQGKALEMDLANPLSQEVTMKASCDNVDIVLQPEYVLRPMGETPCKLIYRPLLASQGVTATNVTFSSPELGDFVYELKTKATAAGADRSMQFKSPIGSTQTQTFRFLHFLPSDCTYECSTDNEMFTVPGTVSASAAETPDGTEVTVEVAFDPSQIGESNGKLLVTSETGGSYTCILTGHGLGPRPQGPFVVSGSYAIDFKNPFPDSKSFIVAVDNPNFKTIEQLPDVPGRSSANISVSYSGGGSGHVQAKLTVVCEGYPPWLYYLKGE